MLRILRVYGILEQHSVYFCTTGSAFNTSFTSNLPSDVVFQTEIVLIGHVYSDQSIDLTCPPAVETIYEGEFSLISERGSHRSVPLHVKSEIEIELAVLATAHKYRLSSEDSFWLSLNNTEPCDGLASYMTMPIDRYHLKRLSLIHI